MIHPHRGRWQAQGDDIVKPVGGHSVPWDQPISPTKAQGITDLGTLETRCEKRQRKLRKTALVKAARHVRRAPLDGYPATGKNKPFYVDPKNEMYPDARVDLDIRAGKAFTGPAR